MANNAKTLEDVRNALLKAFNKAMDNVDYTSYYDGEKLERAVSMVTKTAAQLADVEQKIEIIAMLKDARKSGEFELDVEKGTVRSIRPMGALKLKPSGS